MSSASMLAAAGVWPALPLTGYLLFVRPHHSAGHGLPAITTFALMTTIGLAVWSPLLLGTAIAGVYHAAYLGVLGWAASALAVPLLRTRFGAPSTRRSKVQGPKSKVQGRPQFTVQGVRAWHWVLSAGLLTAGVLYVGFPTESSYGLRDEGVYTMHAVSIAEHGRIDVPYPWPADADAIFADSWVGFPGFYKTRPTMTVQFGHLFPVWLAQAYATFGIHGVFRLNAVLAVLSLAAFSGVALAVVPPPYAVLATLFLAFNLSQLWLARITLSEIPTQLFMWAGLLFLMLALRTADRSTARWSGVLLAGAAMVRLDSMLLAPLLLLSHAAMRIVEEPTGQSGPVWWAFYQAAVPLFGVALALFLALSGPYVGEKFYMAQLAYGTAAGAAGLLLTMTPAVTHIRRLVASTPVLTITGVALFAILAYAYWLGYQPTPAPLVRFRWPGYYYDYARQHNHDSVPSLAAYVSPFVVVAATAGWFLCVWRILRKGCTVDLLPAMIVILGSAAVHLYYPIAEDHIWIVRRLVPMVIPGCVLCAAFAVHQLADALPPHWATAAIGIVFVYLTGFTLYAGRLFFFFAEDKGYYTQIARLAAQLPRNDLILARGLGEWIAPLYVLFDRRVVALNLDANAKGRSALETWVARQAVQGKPAYLLVEGPVDLSGFHARPLRETTITRVFSEPTMTPLPTKIVSQSRTVRLYEITPQEPGGPKPATHTAKPGEPG